MVSQNLRSYRNGPSSQTNKIARKVSGRNRKARTLRKFVNPTRRFIPDHDSTTTNSKNKKRSPASNNMKQTQQPKRRRSSTSSKRGTLSPNKLIGSPELWKQFRGRIRAQLSKIRYCEMFLQAFGSSGWRPTQEKIKPTEEMKRKERQIIDAKLRIKSILEEISQVNSADKIVECIVNANDSGIDVSDLFCSRCSGNDEADDNDLIMCDRKGCNRAYHQMCLDPPLKTEDIPEGDEDWFCHRCECLSDCLELINEEFGSHFDDAESVFPDVHEALERKRSAGDLADSSASDEEFDPQESDDEVMTESDHEPLELEDEEAMLSLPSDFSESERRPTSPTMRHRTRSRMNKKMSPRKSPRASPRSPRQNKKRRVMKLKVESSNILTQSDDSSSEEETPESLIIEGKRKRTIVDYRKLNDAMFGMTVDPDARRGKDWKVGDDCILSSDGEDVKKAVRLSPMKSKERSPLKKEKPKLQKQNLKEGGKKEKDVSRRNSPLKASAMSVATSSSEDEPLVNLLPVSRALMLNGKKRVAMPLNKSKTPAKATVKREDSSSSEDEPISKLLLLSNTKKKMAAQMAFRKQKPAQTKAATKTNPKPKPKTAKSSQSQKIVKRPDIVKNDNRNSSSEDEPLRAIINRIATPSANPKQQPATVKPKKPHAVHATPKIKLPTKPISQSASAKRTKISDNKNPNSAKAVPQSPSHQQQYLSWQYYPGYSGGFGYNNPYTMPTASSPASFHLNQEQQSFYQTGLHHNNSYTYQYPGSSPSSTSSFPYYSYMNGHQHNSGYPSMHSSYYQQQLGIAPSYYPMLNNQQATQQHGDDGEAFV